MTKAKWIQNCKMCNDGIEIAVRERLSDGMSENAACKDLAKISGEEYPELADEFSVSAIRNRWQRTGKGLGARSGVARSAQPEPEFEPPKADLVEITEAAHAASLSGMAEALRDFGTVLGLEGANSLYTDLSEEQKKGWYEKCLKLKNIIQIFINRYEKESNHDRKKTIKLVT